MATLPEPPCLLYLGTSDGLRVARLTGDGLDVVANAIAGNAVRAITVHPDDPTNAYVGCGLRGWGLYHTSDAGRTVETLGFEDRWVWGATRHPDDPETVFVGTEPPMLYRSTDGGSTFDAFEGIDELSSRPEWTFFHEPFYEGHLHGIAIRPERPERIFAGVEHGALVYSHDGGETWAETLVGSDVHRVAIDPTDPDRVFAATGSGMYRSEDAGLEWSKTPDLRGEYLHTIVFDPDEPERMYVYAADDGDPVWKSEDGGNSWRPVGARLPAARPADTLRVHPSDSETLVYAGDTEDGGRLFVSPDAGDTWHPVDHSLPKVWRLEVAPDTGEGVHR